MFPDGTLRGAPDLPYIRNQKRAEELFAKYISPTHEPLWFYRNRGTCSATTVKKWHGFQEEANLDVMEELGIHMPRRMFFFKGFGLEREREYIDKTIAYAKELHKRNMIVTIYVGGTMFTDYFFKEVPEAYEWRRIDMNGHPVTYGNYQISRWFACLNNPDYLAYMKKVLDVAVQEVEADEIFFDNQILRYEPRSCRCKHCIKHLRDGIRKKYTLDECLERYGLREYPDVHPPYFSQATKPWRLDRLFRPQLQDWVDHRVNSVTDFYRTMAGHVKAQRPECVVGMNIKGIHGHNRAFDHGISHGKLADILDFTCIDGYRPGRNGGSDTFHSEIRLFKSTHSTRISVVDMPLVPNLAAVENTVMGFRKKIEGHGWVGDDPVALNPVGRYMCANKGRYYDRERCHDIAVLRSEPSTDYNCSKVHEQLIPFEQSLIVEKLPWGIIFDKNIADIDRYRIIALPEIQAISDEWLGALDAFMKKGGGVIATGKAAMYDHWYRPRDPEHGLERWLGHRPENKYEVAEVGKGRLVYVPEWAVHSPWNFDDWFAIHGQHVRPVKDRALFRKAVGDATVGPPLTHKVTGNDFVVVEAVGSAEGKASGVDLHFINHDTGNTGPVMAVEVGLPEGASSATVTITDPEDEANGYPVRDAMAVVKGRIVRFAVHTPNLYSIASVTFLT